MPKKRDPVAYRNKLLRSIVATIAPMGVTANVSPQRLVGYAKILADLTATACAEPILDHATAPTPSAPAAAKTN